MAYIILLRSDDSASVERAEHQSYNCRPADHINISGGINAYQNSGYVSTFRYNPERPSYSNSLSKATIWESMTNGDSGKGKYVHFIILDTAAFDNQMIHLTGGTSGFEQKMDRNDAPVPQRVDGTVWETPVFDKVRPQIFDTSTVSVELGSVKFRTDYEILLGGNWQKYALCKTFTREEFYNHFKQYRFISNPYPSVEALAGQLIRGENLPTEDKKPAINPQGHSTEQVQMFTQEAASHFTQVKEEFKAAQEREEARQKQEKIIQERKEQAEKVKRVEEEKVAQEWWGSLPEEKQKEIVSELAAHQKIKPQKLLDFSKAYIQICYNHLQSQRERKKEEQLRLQNLKSVHKEVVDGIKILKEEILKNITEPDMNPGEIYAAKNNCDQYKKLNGYLEGLERIKLEYANEDSLRKYLTAAQKVSENFFDRERDRDRERDEYRKEISQKSGHAKLVGTSSTTRKRNLSKEELELSHTKKTKNSDHLEDAFQEAEQINFPQEVINLKERLLALRPPGGKDSHAYKLLQEMTKEIPRLIQNQKFEKAQENFAEAEKFVRQQEAKSQALSEKKSTILAVNSGDRREDPNFGKFSF